MHIGMPPHVKEVILVGAAHCYNKGEKIKVLYFRSGFKLFCITYLDVNYF